MSKFRDDIEEDWREVLDSEEFSVSAIFEGQKETKTIEVLFDEESPVIDPTSGDVIDQRPTALCISSDVIDAKHKDTFTVVIECEDVVFDVIKMHPDEWGMRLIELKRQ